MNFLKQSGSKNVRKIFKKFAFLQCLDYLHFKCILHKQSGSGFKSGINIKVGSGQNNFGSTTLNMPVQKSKEFFLTKFKISDVS
jgi:hypothetical protein